MLELRETSVGEYALAYGGDAFNTAVYAARLGLEVGFISAVGDDHYSDWLLEQWQGEGLNCEFVQRRKNSSPALYIIRNDSLGERYFHYWRDGSPYRSLLRDLAPKRFTSILERYDLVYYTGIGLAMLPVPQRQILLSSLGEYRRSGGKLAFDPNYRPVLWADVGDAVQWIDRAYGIADLILPSMDDESALRQFKSAPADMAYLAEFGVEEVVIKAGEKGCSVSRQGETVLYPVSMRVEPVDTTAAGDSFNAAYLHQRATGGSVGQAVRAAQTLASKVVMHSGAIIPRQEMP